MSNQIFLRWNDRWFFFILSLMSNSPLPNNSGDVKLKTLGEIWFGTLHKQPPLTTDSTPPQPSSSPHTFATTPSDVSDVSDVSDEEEEQPPLHWDPLYQHSPTATTTPANKSKQVLLHKQGPESSADIQSICSSLLRNDYHDDIILIENSRLDRHDLTCLSNALVTNTTVKTLRIVHCNLWSTDARVLTYFLLRNRCLRTLDLSHNVITASGARAIAENLVKKFF